MTNDEVIIKSSEAEGAEEPEMAEGPETWPCDPWGGQTIGPRTWFGD